MKIKGRYRNHSLADIFAFRDRLVSEGKLQGVSQGGVLGEVIVQDNTTPKHDLPQYAKVGLADFVLYDENGKIIEQVKNGVWIIKDGKEVGKEEEEEPDISKKVIFIIICVLVLFLFMRKGKR